MTFLGLFGNCMKRISTVLVAIASLFVATVCTAQIQPSVEPGVIVVKFAPGSSLAAEWFASARSGEIEELTPVLGAHTTRGYLSNATLQAVQKRLSENRNKSGMANSMSHICIVHYSSPLDPAVAARKLSALPGLVYAEPMPVRRFTFVPDDPLRQEQYHLTNIKAFEAWDLLPVGSTALIAIVDTGIEYLHEDLAANIYINPGEDINHNGIIDSGDFNGVDDDGNGFIDDIRGWDFVGTGDGGDNDPRPGNRHGTHVAGIAGAVVNNGIGIAGVAPNIRLLPVKIGLDNPGSDAVSNSYEGVIYAAAMHADVINCSWGGTTKSNAEAEIVANAISLGSLIVAAAGNESREAAFYPAAYTGVLSVGSVTINDDPSGFSNYDVSVDVSAPGSSIYSTIPGTTFRYDYLSGTSMASPVTAGLAALVRMKNPTFTPLQIGEQIKATTDNIDERLDERHKGKFGTGRINALKALATTDAKSAMLLNYVVTEGNPNGVFEPGERIDLSLTILNVLAAVTNARVTASIESEYNFTFFNNMAVLGSMLTSEQRTTGSSDISFTIPSDIPRNYRLELRLEIEDATGRIGYQALKFTLNPTYRTFSENNITATFNSTGNIGFNDYPDNEQGDGFHYKNSPNLLYEGALMVGTGSDRISNVARNAIGENGQDRSFIPTQILDLKQPGSLAMLEGETEFRDQLLTDEAGVRVKQTIHQFDSAGVEDCIFVVYEITNISDRDFSSMYAGLFFDWDIGVSGTNDIANFYLPDNIGYVYNTKDKTLPFIGMQLHTEQDLNYFAMDNDGTTPTNPGVYDGYTRMEKWLTMSEGLGRKTSNITDVSTVISAGPIALKRNESVKVAFSLFAGDTFEQLRAHGVTARETARVNGIGNRSLVDYPNESMLVGLFPNPVINDELFVRFDLVAKTQITIQIYDMIGRPVYSRNDIGKVGPNTWLIPREVLASLASGTYIVQFVTADAVTSLPLRVLR